MAELLPQEVCEQHDACDALRSEFRGMEEKWEKLSQRIEETTAELLTKVTSCSVTLFLFQLMHITG